MRVPRSLMASIACAIATGPALAQPDPDVDELFGMSLDSLMELTINVASRTDTGLLDAPSVVSIITAEDIRRMGARDLRDALRNIPGFELSLRSFAYPEFGLRGVITENTEKLLILLDGLPVNEHLEGSGTIVFGDFPLDNIERIEIIRGPGSALYGTNAFVGVISLISKRPGDDLLELSARGGSFSTWEGSIRSGWNAGDLSIAGFVHFLDTDGDAQRIEQDALQIRDAPPWFSGLNRDISLAGTDRGVTDNARRKLTAQFALDYRGFAFKALAVNAHKGEYVGPFFAVNEHSDGHPNQYQADAAYTFEFGEHWQLEPRAFFRHYVADNLHNAFPDGYRVPDGQGGTITYTRGQYQLNHATQKDIGAELKSTWTFDRHVVIAGLAYETQSLYDIYDRINVPGSGPENMVETPPIIAGEPERLLRTAYLQDQWRLLDTLTMTTGLRMDDYSDAGRSITPRFALVYRPTEALSLKALYGEAFRAPTFVESYLFAADGFFRGDVDNKPETIRTAELVAIYRFGDRALWQVNVFRSRINDLLRAVPNAGGFFAYQNVSAETEVSGVESELRVDFNRDLSGFANYSHTSVEDSPSGERLLGMARTHANLGLNYAASERLNFNASVHFVGDRERAAIDTRAPLDGYRVVDLAVTYQPRADLELSLTAHNLFDGDQRFADVSGSLPGDFPWEGRALALRVTWHND